MYNTDETMKNIWSHLVRDFRSLRGLTYAQDVEVKLHVHGLKDFREHTWPSRFQAPVYVFKQDYQLENFFKRYKFKDDVFTPKQLQEKTISKFLETQVRIATPKHMSELTYRVVQRARTIVKATLGQYDPEVHKSLCNFGRRATVGTPFRESYLDRKASPPFSGSREEQSWFRGYLEGDNLLSRHITSTPCKGPMWLDCDALTLTLVPKSFKSLRSIMPNTDIGAFYTKGLGDYLVEKLKSINLDIRHLQNKHKIWARNASLDLKYVTADLSSASDSFTWDLVCRLVPRDWLRALNMGRKRDCLIDGKRVKLTSFMAMGIGYTFPLQTLLFYALLKSLAELTGTYGRISVFGDDLLYPSALHKYVVHIFPALHLVLNYDKTFSFVPFRESCGGDYYRGCDVRPFQPEGGHSILNGPSYAAFVHKMINGLRMRWADEEISSTLQFLYKECIRAIGCLLQVPPSFPDFSGIRVYKPRTDWFMNWAPVKWSKKGQHFCYAYLGIKDQDRPVLYQLPYYWSSLHKEKEEWNPWTDPIEVIRWVKTIPPVTIRSKLSGRRLRKLIAVVTRKGVTRYHRQVGSIHSWI